MLETPKDYCVAAIYYTMHLLAETPGRAVLAALLTIAALTQI